MASRSSKGHGKLFYKIKDVCELTSTEPYVLRYWEQEFPFLAPEKNKAGHRIYTDADIELVRRIKKLLYDEGYTTAGARRQLERENEGAAEAEPAAAAPSAKTPAPAASSQELDGLRKENAALAKQVKQLEADREGLAGSLRRLQEKVLQLRELVAVARPSSSAPSRPKRKTSSRKAAPAAKKKAAPARKKASATRKKTSSSRSKAAPKRKATSKAKKKAPVRKKAGAAKKRTTKTRSPGRKR